jgi:hypothetical protein
MPGTGPAHADAGSARRQLTSAKRPTGPQLAVTLLGRYHAVRLVMVCAVTDSRASTSSTSRRHTEVVQGPVVQVAAAVGAGELGVGD